MIHEHEALEIASAGIDFGLTPEVERELALTYRECPVCAERAASYQEQIQLMRRLPVLDASAATRQRVMEAALSGRSDTRSPLVLALAAALIVGLLLAMAAAAGALLEHRPADDLLAIQPTPSAGATSATSPNPSQSQQPAVGGGVFGDQLLPDSLAEVVETNVRVRSQPRVADDSTMLEPLLQPGDRLFIVEGPVVANDYDWYRVVPVGATRSRPASELPTGWVSRGDHDANPWIRPVAPDCPSLPVDIADLNATHPLERLACFGDTPLSYWAILEGGSQEGWIARTYGGAHLEGAAKSLEVAVRPSEATRPDLPDLRAAFLEGAFDQPDCRSGGSRNLIEALDCRATFVVTGATIDEADLRPGALALTRTDNLRVRGLPIVGQASAKLELLPRGTRFGIVGGPAVGSGYVWYRIAVPSIRTPDGRARVGWVAAHSADGEQWVGTESFDCAPADAVSLAELARLTAPPMFHGGLACYGGSAANPAAEITVDARVRRDCSQPAGTGSFWLTDPGRVIALSNGAVELRAILAEKVETSDPCPRDLSALWYRATGHFDDDAASQCRSPGADARIPDPAASYECRMRFIVTSLVGVGASASRAPGAP